MNYERSQITRMVGENTLAGGAGYLVKMMGTTTGETKWLSVGSEQVRRVCEILADGGDDDQSPEVIVVDGENSERGREVTRQVGLLVTNDSVIYHHAQELSDVVKVATYVVGVLRDAWGRPYSAAWHVMQELAPNDLARINWNDIVEELHED